MITLLTCITSKRTTGCIIGSIALYFRNILCSNPEIDRRLCVPSTSTANWAPAVPTSSIHRLACNHCNFPIEVAVRKISVQLAFPVSTLSQCNTRYNRCIDVQNGSTCGISAVQVHCFTQSPFLYTFHFIAIEISMKKLCDTHGFAQSKFLCFLIHNVLILNRILRENKPLNRCLIRLLV